MAEAKFLFNDIRDSEDIYLPGDHLLYAEALEGQIRMQAVNATESLRAIRDKHDLGPSATYALGQLVLASLLLAGDLKDKSAWLSLILQSEGDLGRLVVEVNEDLSFRAKAANPLAAVHFNAKQQIDLTENIAGGRLTVIRSFGKGEPFVSQMPLNYRNIAKDVTYYLAKSEQRHSAVILGVDLNKDGIVAAVGLFIEALPGASEKTLNYVEERLAAFPELSFLLQSGFNSAQILDMLLMDENIRYLKRKEINIACSCSIRKMQDALQSLGAKDLQELLTEPSLTMQCEFCKNTYTFSSNELAALLESKIAEN